uniref:Uncharacterized protein n=1 Tax=Oryza sativa subsp. japonica TaxID=39947 RepID=Q337Z4_ORYSJ|nr:hypothetical protein LOC_Os10g28800 [Oryza sativa Japonica Group]
MTARTARARGRAVGDNGSQRRRRGGEASPVAAEQVDEPHHAEQDDMSSDGEELQGERGGGALFLPPLGPVGVGGWRGEASAVVRPARTSARSRRRRRSGGS